MTELPSITASSPDIPTLRVAQAELMSGDTSGKVYVRLSEGSVAFLVDRPQAQSEVAAQLRRALLNDIPHNNKTNIATTKK
jgi:hypothetical protein